MEPAISDGVLNLVINGIPSILIVEFKNGLKKLVF